MAAASDTTAPEVAAAASAEAPSWDGQASQDELMHKDCCAVVDARDNVTGAGSKWDVHRFEGATPTGTLHRAFSAFVFDTSGRLLLQQRAVSKITFPGVWTNSCCSHPLVGYSPTEIDTQEDVAAGRAPGAVRAAIRKLGHELGMPAAQLPPGGFKFLTRLHYCAADTHTHGQHSPWGEHEMDYILFFRAPDASALMVVPNPEEVGAIEWVTRERLADMMRPDSGLLWSPWFRIIAQRFLPTWWADLDVTLGTDTHVDAETIHTVWCALPHPLPLCPPSGARGEGVPPRVEDDKNLDGRTEGPPTLVALMRDCRKPRLTSALWLRPKAGAPPPRAHPLGSAWLGALVDEDNIAGRFSNHSQARTRELSLLLPCVGRHSLRATDGVTSLDD